MTKMRVYELAKELEMENKILVDAIREMNIEVKSHSSSLSDEEVTLIKGHLSGTKSLVVEEQRIKSTVIRRRRKIVEVAPEPAAEIPAIELPPQPDLEAPPAPEPPPPSQPLLETPADQEMEVTLSALPEKQPLSEKAAQPAKPAPEVLPKPVRPPRPPKMTPAKVIRAAEPAPAPPAPAPATPVPVPVQRIEEKKEEEGSKKEKAPIKKTLKATRVTPETETAKAKVFKKRKEILERAALYDDSAREGRPGKGIEKREIGGQKV